MVGCCSTQDDGRVPSKEPYMVLLYKVAQSQGGTDMQMEFRNDKVGESGLVGRASDREGIASLGDISG